MNKPASIHGRRLEWLGTAIVVAAAMWYWLQFFNRNTNLLDEGSTAAQALRVVRGELIYRDFFTVVTPGSYYTAAWLFQLFGAHLMVLRWAALITGIGILIATLVVTRRLASWPFAAGAALLTTVWGWFLCTPNFYSLEAALFALTGLGVFLHAQAGEDDRAQRRMLLVSGIAVGVTAMVKQNVGTFAAIALVLSIWLTAIFDSAIDARRRVRETLAFIAGICIPVVPTVIWLVAAGAGPYLYESWVYYPLVRYPERFALPFPSFFPLSGTEPFELWTKLVIYMPVVVYPAAAVALILLVLRARRGDAGARHEGRALLTVTLAGMFAFLQAWPRADVTHILFGLQPTFALFAYLLARLVRSPGVNRPMASPQRSTAWRLLPLLATLPLVLLLWKGYQRTTWEYQNYVAGLHVERGRGVFAQFVEAKRIDTVTQYIVDHSAPDDGLFVVPWASGFNFFTDRMNPTRTDFMLFEDPEAYPCLLARLDERPPTYVIYGYTWDVDNKRFRDYAAPVDQYIRSRYAIEFTTDGYEIWRRIGDAPAAPSRGNACQPRRFRWRDLVR